MVLAEITNYSYMFVYIASYGELLVSLVSHLNG